MTPAPESPDAALVERLRNASHGYNEWRVQDPKDGSYCIAFSRGDYSIDPERDARMWLAEHAARFPTSSKSGYVVACVRVQTTADKMMLEATDTITRLTAERDAARRDAERYRFLRADFSPMGLNIGGQHAWAYRRNATLKGPSLDEAIDAALSAQERGA